MRQQENRIGEQFKDVRAGMRQLEMKIDKTAADVNWIRGVLEGYGREPEKNDLCRGGPFRNGRKTETTRLHSLMQNDFLHVNSQGSP